MEKISPKDRFNQNPKSISTPIELLHDGLRQFGLNPEKCELKQLSGGFMNANFLAAGEGRRIVLRVYSSDANTAQKEFDLLRFLEERPVSTPKVLANFRANDRPVVVMEYLDGITLEEKILNGEPLDSGIYEGIGRELGEIHKIEFSRAGFLGPKMAIAPDFDNFSAFIGKFIEKTLKDLEDNPDRLDLETNKRFRLLVQDKWHLVTKTERLPQLTHCDFNPKNILVSKGQHTAVLGVIDWEFSISANGLIDFGNFFRFSYDYPHEARDRFLAGYRSVNPNLSPDWEDCARLIDLGSICGFLERKEDYAKTFRTARAVVKSTLESFGY